MPDATAKFPGTAGVSQAALTDFGGEFVGLGENEWTANGATTAIAGVPFSLVVNEAISARVAVGTWLTTANNEILHVSAINTGTKTFTIDARAQMDTTAAAIDSGSAIGLWLTKRTVNQILAELISMQTKLLVGDLPNLVLNSDFSRRTVFGLAMPEVFADLSGTTKIDGGAAGAVASNIFTQGAANNEYAWCAGSFVWRDGRTSATFKATAIAGIYEQRWRISATDYISVKQNNGNMTITKFIASALTVVSTVANVLTINKWYWIELEKQGTTVTVRMYDTGGTVPGVTKASSTLIAGSVLTATIADASVAVGASVSITSDQAAAQWGGIATGNGGVYVETWLPESFGTITFGGTLGGQAVGYDEAADSGPIGKQNALRCYIPATSRNLAVGLLQRTADGTCAPSTAYMSSVYVKVSGFGGTGALAAFYAVAEQTNNTLDANSTLQANSTDTSWARKTGAVTSLSTSRHWRFNVTFNDASTATGTAWVMLPQVEQGSAATAWRGAPADDAPIVWQFSDTTATLTTTSATQAEPSPRDLAGNLFFPWDCNVDVEFTAAVKHSVVANYVAFHPRVDGSNISPNDEPIYFEAQRADTYGPAAGTVRAQLAAGKHRVAMNWAATGATGSMRRTSVMRVTAFRGK